MVGQRVAALFDHAPGLKAVQHQVIGFVFDQNHLAAVGHAARFAAPGVGRGKAEVMPCGRRWHGPAGRRRAGKRRIARALTGRHQHPGQRTRRKPHHAQGQASYNICYSH